MDIRVLGNACGWVLSPATCSGRSLIFFHHRTGIDEFTRQVVRDILCCGVRVAVPDLFANIPTELGPGERKQRIVDSEVIGLTQLAILALTRDDAGAAPAALGFCMGGRLAFLVAAANLGVARACCFYGGELTRGWHDPQSPIDRVTAKMPPIQLHRGSRDSNATRAEQDAALSAVDAVDGYLEACVYTGARHAFANPFVTERFHPTVARRAWDNARSFLELA
ncbi:dienelactone hydrolase family protein [Frankia sp. Cr1]|uniref:dienelactone hydrolase family protein n=1 Tax=Frankia sp. Cr1 TaxID=3073931 RepID=UPI002AD39347|nr:dienelactone hydrolase family protein [Frankia sp. Cr1]